MKTILRANCYDMTQNVEYNGACVIKTILESKQLLQKKIAMGKI